MDHSHDAYPLHRPPFLRAAWVEACWVLRKCRFNGERTCWPFLPLFLKGRAMRSFDTAVSGAYDQHTANVRTLVSVGFALLVVRACGVVYGDIGTSVLYTLREIFFGAHTYGQVPITRDNILGAVSLIFWALLLLITIKYISFVLYADDHGEGGVFALLGLLNGVKYL